MPQFVEGKATVSAPIGSLLIKLDEEVSYTKKVQSLMNGYSDPGCPDGLFAFGDNLFLFELKDYFGTTEAEFRTGLLVSLNKTAIQKFVGGLLTLQILEQNKTVRPVSSFKERVFHYQIRLPDFQERNQHKAYRRMDTLVQLNTQADAIRRKVRLMGFNFKINADLSAFLSINY